jgi:hypothetical protein
MLNLFEEEITREELEELLYNLNLKRSDYRFARKQKGKIKSAISQVQLLLKLCNNEPIISIKKSQLAYVKRYSEKKAYSQSRQNYRRWWYE